MIVAMGRLLARYVLEFTQLRHYTAESLELVSCSCVVVVVVVVVAVVVVVGGEVVVGEVVVVVII